ncbi:fibronectin type III domain-containing protein [Prosthecobacter sp.]|uniref:fibronectin type III domain-containing protein n=1 Tax=Prosthecobacter sp. TaxID=1965333 RepID=UPI003784A6CC
MTRILLFLLLCSTSRAASIQRIWLTIQREEPTHLTVNWETAQPADSEVSYGTSASLGSKVAKAEEVTLHHIEIPISEKDATYHYQVRSGTETSEVCTFKSMPSQELRIAVVGDWGFAQPDLAALIKDDPHVLMTAGDNVSSLHQQGREGTRAFSALIDSQPKVFSSTIFMPILGNHDREIRSRGPKPPPEAVYDVDATAYREFFALPGNEWNWTLSFPDFSARIVALDLEHIQDMGTTWQTGHPFDAASAQLAWYRQQMEPSHTGHTITLQNERNATMRSQLKGEWGRLFQQGTAVITGFGYFAERAMVDGFPYYNTALKGNGDKYPDPKSSFFASEHSYILLTFKPRSPMKIEIKKLTGEEMDAQSYPAK